MWGRRPRGQPLVIGHRGASAIALENTTDAFQRAAADGADGIELDVLPCATGEVLVFHDDDLRRLGERPERVRDLPFAAVREVRLRGGGAIPTLLESLEACGPALLVNVEIKSSGLAGAALVAFVDRVASDVECAGAGGRVLVSSFEVGALRIWRRRAPSIPVALLHERTSPVWVRRGWLLPWLSPLAVHPEAELATAEAVEGWHRRGYAVNIWTVDDPAQLLAARRAGVDGIITNDPGRARRILAGATG